VKKSDESAPLPDPRHRQAWARRKAAASVYQPKRVRLLLVAESPPADDRAYFYFADESASDPLFEEVCGVLFEAKPAGNTTACLKELRRRGIFVVELKPDAPRADEALSGYVGPLLLNLDALSPEKIVLISADVYAAAFREMASAGLPVVDMKIPFPSAGHEVEFRQAFRQALVRAGLEKMIRPLPAAKDPK
jgi:hypothetical protein